VIRSSIVYSGNEDDTENRDYSHDSLTVVDGLEGSYPNFFFEVHIDDLEEFTETFTDLERREDYEALIESYGIRRTNEKFWITADWFQARYQNQDPILAGLFDLNRYLNR